MLQGLENWAFYGYLMVFLEGFYRDDMVWDIYLTSGLYFQASKSVLLCVAVLVGIQATLYRSLIFKNLEWQIVTPFQMNLNACSKTKNIDRLRKSLKTLVIIGLM